MTNPILLEVLRCKLEAIADEGARAVQRTAISPVVADAGDCSCAIFTPNGDLMVGGGNVQAHFKTGSNGIREILERHGSTLQAGDLFLTNDPYNGGGFHAQDVFIHQPVFIGGELVAWVGSSAHMMDMGGSVPGSFAPGATECYQEALRFPPVRLSKAGVEQSDIWSILRCNIRVASLVEMDMRALISGSNVIARGLSELVEEYTAPVFAEAVRELIALSEREMRRRIAQLEPGVYAASSWTEWTEELFLIPCTLTIDEDFMTFDYTGASPQSKHYFNSKPYVVKSLLGVEIAAYIARDLPFNEGIFNAFDVVAEPGSIMDADMPAPIGGPHLDVGQNAIEVGIRAMMMAVMVSPGSIAHSTMAGPTSGSGYGLHTWSGLGLDGKPDSWLMLEGGAVGSSAGFDRDGCDYYQSIVGKGSQTEIADVEILESWYPILYERRGPARGAAGAGKFRSGRGSSAAYRTTSAAPLFGAILGNRERVPIAGTAGGEPGALTKFRVRTSDGELSVMPCHSQGNMLEPGVTFEYDICSGGGWGDPIERSIELVEADVRHGQISEDDAARVYGVVIGDVARTEQLRQQILASRLERAEPALKPLQADAIPASAWEGASGQLHVGVEQRGSVAVSERSGAPLAISPAHWTDGCPRLVEPGGAKGHYQLVRYLDPVTGYALAVDVVAQGLERAFSTQPRRWTDAAEIAAREEAVTA
ncbi:hydantoinase B/oxoprolinase family protein [Blastomonas sp.]|uniref:hydantoinase B/oxoprolinase family protein n=1 Tax=Blastomonas sp. TaxID=1909299 RepID=UPI00406A98D7